MSVSHCMDRVLDVARQPEGEWPASIERLPEGCGFADCGEPRSCRQRAREYLRVQWQVRRALERKGRAHG